MKKILNYWREFGIDFKIWRKYRKIARQNQDFLLEKGMRVDWLGRIYTVVNMPEEVITNQETVQQGWVLQQLSPLNDALMNIGVNDYAYPEITKVPNSNSYLIVMYPEIDALNPFRIIWNLLGLGIIASIVYVLVSVLGHYGVVDMIKTAVNG
jgi:hypothetical protein